MTYSDCSGWIERLRSLIMQPAPDLGRRAGEAFRRALEDRLDVSTDPEA